MTPRRQIPYQPDMFPIGGTGVADEYNRVFDRVQTVSAHVRKLMIDKNRNKEKIGRLLETIQRSLGDAFEKFLADELPEIGGPEGAGQFIAAADALARQGRSKTAK